jgi:hypothetical protein
MGEGKKESIDVRPNHHWGVVGRGAGQIRLGLASIGRAASK